MNRKPSSTRRARMAALALFAWAACAAAQAGALLDFKGSDICAAEQDGVGSSARCRDGSYINQDYGDRTGLDVQYKDLSTGAERSLYWWGAGYSGVDAVLWSGQSDSDSHGRITLQALAGHSVSLAGLDLGAYGNDAQRSSVRVYELGSASDLFLSEVDVAGSGAIHLDFGQAQSTRGWVIEWQESAWNVGLSNIAFDVTGAPSQIPEPASLALVGMGLLAALGSRRRSKLPAA